jgi:hypothetical protein
MDSSSNPLLLFDIKDCCWNEESGEAPYRRRKQEKKIAVHHGQRKLLLTEIWFLTLVKPPPGSLIVYVGAAGGEHIPLLVSLFPNYVYHLFDPKSYHSTVKQLSDNNRNVIIRPEGNFTDEIARTYSGTENLYFISDIRIVDSSITLQYNNNAQKLFNKPYDNLTPPEALKVEEVTNNTVSDFVKDDMDFQNSWIRIMQPEASYLKFRLPYTDGVTETFTQYPGGHIFFQPWVGQTSTECRLLCFPPYDLVTYSDLQHERVMSYHNLRRETLNLFVNLFDASPNPQDPGVNLNNEPELINDFDSTYEVYILFCYFYLYKDLRDNYQDEVLSLSRRITLKLLHGTHRTMFSYRSSGTQSGLLRNANEQKDIVKRGDGFTFRGRMSSQYENDSSNSRRGRYRK